MEKMNKARAVKAATIFLGILSVFFVIKGINEIRTGQTIGYTTPATDTIVVSGKGDVVAAPDIATFSFTVDEQAKTVAEAQKQATDRSNKALAYLKGAGVADKDVQTQSYDIHPNYDYQNSICTANMCPPSKAVLTGYEVSESVLVKVRDISKAGDVLSGIGQLGVQNVSGLSLTLDKPEEAQRQARAKAIADAQDAAKNLASSLGVTLVRIVSFNESNNNPGPIYYGKAMSMGADSTAAASPQIAVGENKITSNVTITYEIR